MRLIDADEAKKLERMFTLKPSERALFRLMLDRMPTYEPPNDPLTLEELREMDGDKIYIHYIDGFYTDEDGAYFGKFEAVVRECNKKLTACALPMEYYGKKWLAYRRKPEGEKP